MATPNQRDNHKRYDFLDITEKIDATSRYVQKLDQNFVDIFPYKSEEQIAHYLQGIAI